MLNGTYRCRQCQHHVVVTVQRKTSRRPDTAGSLMFCSLRGPYGRLRTYPYVASTITTWAKPGSQGDDDASDRWRQEAAVVGAASERQLPSDTRASAVRPAQRHSRRSIDDNDARAWRRLPCTSVPACRPSTAQTARRR
ncbi:hypothetical protein LSAT2_020490 [Lamellibrachia satsuma]|nr:hypothetical protein LSAT2_020490 [Lamellibrachia satsuma]